MSSEPARKRVREDGVTVNIIVGIFKKGKSIISCFFNKNF